MADSADHAAIEEDASETDGARPDATDAVGWDGADTPSEEWVLEGVEATPTPVVPADVPATIEDAAATCATSSCPVTMSLEYRLPARQWEFSLRSRPSGAWVLQSAESADALLATIDLTTRAITFETPPLNHRIGTLHPAPGGAFYIVTRDQSFFERAASTWRRTDYGADRAIWFVHHTRGVLEADGTFTLGFRSSEWQHQNSCALATRDAGGRLGVRFIPTSRPPDHAIVGSTSAGFTVAYWRQEGVSGGSATTLILRTPDGAAREVGPHVDLAIDLSVWDPGLIAVLGQPGSAGHVIAGAYPTGLRVLVGQADGYRDLPVGRSMPRLAPECPLGLIADCASTRTRCTERRTFVGQAGHALLRTADGRTWIVYTQDVVDADWEATGMSRGSLCQYQLTVLADRGSTDLVIAEVGAELTERLRLRMAGAAVAAAGGVPASLQGDVEGNMLHIVRAVWPRRFGDPTTTEMLVHYDAIDASLLR